MDQATATVIVGVVTAIAAIVPGTLATIFAYRANARSTANTATLLQQNVVLDKVSKQTDGLVAQQIDAERRVSDARENVARHEGSDQARKEGEDRAIAILAAIPATPLAPVEVSIVEATAIVPVEIKENGKK